MGYYVSGCKDNGSETVTCDDIEAQFWTLYARDESGLSQGVIDLAFREDAESAMAVYLERDVLREQLARYSMSAGHADQRRAESVAIRTALGFGADAEDVAPCDLVDAITALKEQVQAKKTGFIEGIYSSIFKLEKSKFGDENDIRILKEFAAAIRAGEQP